MKNLNNSELIIMQRKRIKLRQFIRQQRAQLNETFIKKAAEQIVKTLITHPLLKQKHTIAGYFATEHEVDMQLWFHHAWKHAIPCYLPVMVNQTLSFAQYAPDTTLIKNQWDILEPPTKNLIYPQQLDIVSSIRY